LTAHSELVCVFWMCSHNLSVTSQKAQRIGDKNLAPSLSCYFRTG